MIIYLFQNDMCLWPERWPCAPDTDFQRMLRGVCVRDAILFRSQEFLAPFVRILLEERQYTSALAAGRLEGTSTKIFLGGKRKAL